MATMFYRQLLELEKCGRITEDIRNALVSIRNGQHLSRAELARYLGVTVVTLAKWELGPTTRCALVFRRKLAQFLRQNLETENWETDSPEEQGELQVAEDAVPYGMEVRHEEDSDLRHALERIVRICRSCASFPQLRDLFLKHLREMHAQVLSQDGWGRLPDCGKFV